MDAQEESQPSQDSFMTITDEDRHEILYFAYGHNLSTDLMRRQCPYSTPIGLGYLPSWRWIINSRGCANIVSPDNSTLSPSSSSPSVGVYGLIYLLPPRDEELLDAYEAVPTMYDKMQCSALWIRDGQGKEVAGGGEKVNVLVYVDEKHTDVGTPRDGEYVNMMEEGVMDGMENWGLDKGYVDSVLRKFWK